MQAIPTQKTPSGAGAWIQALGLWSSLLAGVLGGSALVYWVAANWPRMGADARLALVQGVLALIVVAAALLAWRRSRWAGLLAGMAALATGALLALVGQIYQTGADAWQLYLLWAVLIMPWLVLMRTVFLGLLWAVLLNLCLLQYGFARFDGAFWPAGIPGGISVWLVGLNGLLLALSEWLRIRLHDPWNLCRRVLALAVLGWVFAAAIHWIPDGSARQAGQALVAGLIVLSILYGAYTRWRGDLAVVALTLLTGIGLVGLFVGQIADSLDALLGLALLLFALSVVAARHLLRLRHVAGVADGVSAEAEADAKTDDTVQADAAADPYAAGAEPWYLSVLRIGALLPVVVLLVLWLVVGLELITVGGCLGLGIALMIAGLGLSRGLRAMVWREAGGVLTVVGLVLCVGAVLALMDTGVGRLERLVILLGAGALVYGATQAFAVRFVAAGVALGAALWITLPTIHGSSYIFGGFDDATGAWPAHLAMRLWACLAAGTGFWIGSLRAGRGAIWRPLAWALLWVSAAVAALIAQADQFSVWVWPLSGRLAMLACAILPGLLLGAWMSAVRPAPPRALRWTMPAILCVAGLAWIGAPVLSVALVWVVLGRLSGHRLLQALGLPLGLGGLVLYCQNTGISLVDKAWMLALAALCLGAAAVVLAWRRRRAGPARPSSGTTWRLPAGLLAGGLLVFGVAQAQILHYETILAHGRKIVLQLAPVDPRSLVQGDYMALDYAVRGQANSWLSAHPAVGGALAASGHGWLLLRVDDQGVWRLRGVTAALPRESTKSNIALAFRWRGARMDWGGNSWFFPEGRASHYAQARYGLLRVASDGTALLAGLLDAQLRPL